MADTDPPQTLEQRVADLEAQAAAAAAERKSGRKQGHEEAKRRFGDKAKSA